MPTDPYRDSVHIAAQPERVFEYFTQPGKLTTWMGERAVLDPRPGGEFRLYIAGVPVVGHYREISPPRRVVITWGRAGSAQLPAGASTLEITLTPEHGGTLVEIVHSGLPEPEAQKHAIGWNHYLPRLATTATGADPGPDPWQTSLPEVVRPE